MMVERLVLATLITSLVAFAAGPVVKTQHSQFTPNNYTDSSLPSLALFQIKAIH